MSEAKPGDGVSRRTAAKMAASAAVAAVVAGVGGYVAGQAGRPPEIAPEGGVATTTVTVTGAATGVQPPRTIKIGTTIHRTGVLAAASSFLWDLHTTMAQMINERGGVYVKEFGMRLPIEVVLYDDKSDIPTCEKYAERLATVDQIDVMIGVFATPWSLAASPIADKYRVVYIDSCGGSPPIYQRGLNYVTGIQNIVPLWTRPYLEMLRSEGKVKKIALLYADESFGIEAAGGASESAKEFGIDVVADLKVPFTATDFSAEIAKLRATDPDVVCIFSNFPSTHAGVFKQAMEAGYQPREWHADPVEMWVAGNGPEASENITADIFWTKSLSFNPGIFPRTMVYDLADKINLDLVMQAMIFGLDATAHLLAVQAIETAGTLDHDKINDVLHWQRAMGVHGLTRTRPLDDPIAPGAGTCTNRAIQVQQGQWKLLWPPEEAEAPHIYPATG